MLSYLVIAAEETISRMLTAFAIGFLLAIGPFERVIVRMLHVIFGIAATAEVNLTHVLEVGFIALAGNLIGGVGW